MLRQQASIEDFLRAAAHNDRDLVRSFIVDHLDNIDMINVESTYQIPAILLTSQHDHYKDIVMALPRVEGVNDGVKIKLDSNRTLHIDSFNNYLKIIRNLIEAGSEIKGIISRDLVLVLSAKSGDLIAVKTLLGAQAPIYDCKNLVEKAKADGYQEIADMLIAAEKKKPSLVRKPVSEGWVSRLYNFFQKPTSLESVQNNAENLQYSHFTMR